MNKDDLKKFIDHRNYLINRLEADEIDKTEFIEMNAEYFKDGEHCPIKTIKTVDEGIFNYQYYNSKAKMSMLKSNELEFRNPRQSQKYYDDCFDFYYKKDRVTEEILELVKYKNVEAYFIKLNSQDLHGELFEILLLDHHRAILHSKCKRILNRLKKAGVFCEDCKKSAICEYINTKY